MRGKHNKLGEGERKVRLGQDSLPNIAISVAETSGVVSPGPHFYRGHLFLWPHGTTLMAFADVKYGCLQMLDGLVSTHLSICFS